MAWRSGARCDRRIKAVDIDSQIDWYPSGHPPGRGLDPKPAGLPNRKDVRSHSARRFVTIPSCRGYVADADLRQARHPGLFGRATHRVAVTEPHAVPFVDEVEMRINLHDVERAAALVCVNAGNVDRMVAPEHHRQRAGTEDAAYAGLDVGVAPQRVRMHDVSVAKVNYADIIEIGDIVLVVVRTRVTEREQRRGIADGARTEPSARAPLRAEVERRAEDRDIGIDPVPVWLIGAPAESRDTDERQVEPSGLVAVFPPSATLRLSYTAQP